MPPSFPPLARNSPVVRLLEKADLRGAELDIIAGFESLRGAIMTTAQFLSLAPALARQLGVELRDG